MSKLGPLAFGGEKEPIFLGRDFSQKPSYSDDTARRIDQEVERIVQEANETARSILTERRDVLERLARDLLEQESMSGNEVYDLIEEITGIEMKRSHYAPRRPATLEADEGTDVEPESEPEAQGSPPVGAEPEPAPAQCHSTFGELL